MEYKDNITFRRAKTVLAIADRNDSNMSIDPLDVSTNSLPELSTEEGPNKSLLENYEQKIELLQIQLNSAHEEIEQLSLENKDLRKNNQELAKKNALYRKIGFSPSKATPRKNKESIQKTKVHQQTQTDSMNMIPKETQTNTQSPKPKSATKILQDRENLTATGNKIPNIAKPVHKCLPSCELSYTYKPKICLLSSNKENKVLSIAQDVMPKNDFKLCHYLTPQASTLQMLTGLEDKLSNFTMKDYCIVLMSDQDILETKNYVALIKNIKEFLQEITHTNVIICTPTYHYGYGKDVINRKIYNFNELLLLNVQTHKYASLIDANKYLVYNYSMFHKPSGKINNAGLQTVFQNLSCLIKNGVSNNVKLSESSEVDLANNDYANTQNQLFRV